MNSLNTKTRWAHFSKIFKHCIVFAMSGSWVDYRKPNQQIIILLTQEFLDPSLLLCSQP